MAAQPRQPDHHITTTKGLTTPPQNELITEPAPSAVSTAIYKPLLPNEIRILELQPGAVQSEIQCRLSTARFDYYRPYEALSYVWGDGPARRPISVDGARVHVTANLEAALRQLRKEKSVRYLWVDALCINQADPDEKEAQVRIMYDIYQQSKVVVAWLGEADAESAAAMSLIDSFAGFLKNMWSKDDNWQSRATGTRERQSEVFARLGYPLERQNWSSLWRHLHRPYWSRMWVLQELATAGHWKGRNKPCIVQCGTQMTSFHNLQIVLEQVRAILVRGLKQEADSGAYLEPFKSFTEQGSTEPPGLVMTELLTRLHREELDILKLLYLTSRLKATDPRDKIYALLGLIPSAQALRPDYRRSTSATLINHVQNWVEREGTLDVIFSNRLDPCTSGLPGWTPEIRAEHQAYSEWERMGVDTRFRAGYGKGADVEIFQPYQNNGETPPMMRARGIVIGELESIIGPSKSDESAPQSTTKINTGNDAGQRFIDTIFTPLQEFAARINDGTPEYETFWRTLTLNVDDRWPPGLAPDSFRVGSLLAFSKRGQSPSKKDVWFHKIKSWFNKKELNMLDYSNSSGSRGPSIDARVRFMRHMSNCIHNRTFFTTTSRKFMGLGPYGAQKGDIVVVLYGSKRCVVLRPRGAEGGGYVVIGTAYVHGVMGGELLRRDKVDETVFNLY
jgi:hypothetical protein